MFWSAITCKEWYWGQLHNASFHKGNIFALCSKFAVYLDAKMVYTMCNICFIILNIFGKAFWVFFFFSFKYLSISLSAEWVLNINTQCSILISSTTKIRIIIPRKYDWIIQMISSSYCISVVKSDSASLKNPLKTKILKVLSLKRCSWTCSSPVFCYLFTTVSIHRLILKWNTDGFSRTKFHLFLFRCATEMSSLL